MSAAANAGGTDGCGLPQPVRRSRSASMVPRSVHWSAARESASIRSHVTSEETRRTGSNPAADFGVCFRTMVVCFSRFEVVPILLLQRCDGLKRSILTPSGQETLL